MMLVNTQTIMSTFCFDVELFGDMIDLDDNNRGNVEEMVSCLLLPISIHHDDNFATTKYYIHTEEHKELLDANMNFSYPGIYASDRVEHQLRSNVPVQDALQNSVDISDRGFCESFVGKHVVPIENTTEGIVSSFKYSGHRRTFDDAEWTVRYTINDTGMSRRVRRKAMNYTELMEVLLDIDDDEQQN